MRSASADTGAEPSVSGGTPGRGGVGFDIVNGGVLRRVTLALGVASEGW